LKSIRQIARDAGLHHSSMSRWLQYLRAPSFNSIDAIVNYYGLAAIGEVMANATLADLDSRLEQADKRKRTR
jgi:DNA-binding phage protein